MVPEQREPWASVYTKRLAGVDVVLNGPAGAFATGRIAELGSQRAIANDGNNRDQVKFRFVEPEDLVQGDLDEFLAEHLGAVRGDGGEAL